MRRYGVISLLLGVGLLACDQWQPEPDDAPTPYSLEIPEGFLPMVIPEDNPTTVEGVALGRQLFFDPILSGNQSMSCASCHVTDLAFTDGKAVSIGVGQAKGKRSAPSLLNVGFHYKGLFWDGRSPTLEEQALHPVADPVEMAASWPLVEIRLRNHPSYFRLFQEAFGITTKEALTKELVGKALAQFQRTLISANSKFDRVMAKTDQFTSAEHRGWKIFFDAGYPDVPMAECSHCHADPLFTNLAYENNGLDEAPNGDEFPDPGRGEITKIKSDMGRFKVPTLRNIAQTAPYMHDGRFATLEEVIDHYNAGGHHAENVNPNVRPLRLADQDKQDLIAFLQTLTDSSALQNSHYRSK